MKKTNCILTLVALAILFACKPPVTFNEPQPPDTDNLSKFPKRVQGQYLSLANKSTLLISDNLIRRIYDYDDKIHPNQLDSNSKLSGDTMIDLKTNEKNLIKRDGDSLVFHVHGVDTLFRLSYDNVLRKFKGYYFLNIRYNKESWVVKKVHLSKGQLIISGISTKQDIETLKEITEMSQDTVPVYRFSPTKKQFNEFIKRDGFSDSETFVKQK